MSKNLLRVQARVILFMLLPLVFRLETDLRFISHDDDVSAEHLLFYFRGGEQILNFICILESACEQSTFIFQLM